MKKQLNKLLVLVFVVGILAPVGAQAGGDDWSYVGSKEGHLYTTIWQTPILIEEHDVVFLDEFGYSWAPCDVMNGTVKLVSECPHMIDQESYDPSVYWCCEVLFSDNMYNDVEKMDVLVYSVSPGMSFGVEAKLFGEVLAQQGGLPSGHIEQCGGSDGVRCRNYWAQRAFIDRNLTRLVSNHTPSDLFERIGLWASNLFSKKVTSCAVLQDMLADVPEMVRTVGHIDLYYGVPRTEAALIFRPTGLTSSELDAIENRWAAHKRGAGGYYPYDYANLTTHYTNGDEPGWGGCSAALDSANNLSVAQGHRATNAPADAACEMVKGVLPLMADSLYSGIRGYDGVDQSLGACGGITIENLAWQFSYAFLNGAVAREDKDFTCIASCPDIGEYEGRICPEFSSTNGCRYYVGPINFVTSPADTFFNLMGGPPTLEADALPKYELQRIDGVNKVVKKDPPEYYTVSHYVTSFSECSTANKAICSNAGADCMHRNNESACVWPMETRDDNCPGVFATMQVVVNHPIYEWGLDWPCPIVDPGCEPIETYTIVDWTGPTELSPMHPFIQQHPWFFADRNSKCIELVQNVSDLGGGCNGESQCGWSFCCSSSPCNEGGGDCDSDADCAGSLICGTDNGAEAGCDPIADLCVSALGGGCNGESQCGWAFCCSSSPCNEGGGDCDSDAECASGLICGTDNGPAYGCSDSAVDICIPGGSQSCPTIAAGTTYGSTTGESDDFAISCASGGGADDCYSWTAYSTGTYTIDTCSSGTNYDSALAIFSADGSQQLACNDDGSGCTNYRSEIEFSATAGQTYTIVVDGYNGDSGNYELTITAPGGGGGY
jgi:hypothetical protein